MSFENEREIEYFQRTYRYLVIRKSKIVNSRKMFTMLALYSNNGSFLKT